MKTSKAFFALWNLIMLKKMISETKKERYIFACLGREKQ